MSNNQDSADIDAANEGNGTQHSNELERVRVEFEKNLIRIKN